MRCKVSLLDTMGSVEICVASIIQEEELLICKKWNQPPPALPQQTRPQTGQKARSTNDIPDYLKGDISGQHKNISHLEPWSILEKLVVDLYMCTECEIMYCCSWADCLLEEALCGVATEMEYACDSIANSLFFLEFQVP